MGAYKSEHIFGQRENPINSCNTSGKPSNSFPDEAALKIYFAGEGKNFTDLGM